MKDSYKVPLVFLGGKFIVVHFKIMKIILMFGLGGLCNCFSVVQMRVFIHF